MDLSQKPADLPISDADWQQSPASMQTLAVMLWEQVKRLQQRVAELEGKGRRRQPPPPGTAPGTSADTTAAASAPKPPPSGRSPGGQPGHPGHGRSLLPPERVDQVVPVHPAACRHCGRALSGQGPVVHRHQVVEVPLVRAHVTEYRLHVLACPHCQQATEAELPAGVPHGGFGPGVQAWVGMLSGGYRLSKRNVRSLLSEAFSIDLALGTVSQLERHVSAALAMPVDEARAYVQQQPAVNLDETGWRERRISAWIWTAATPWVTVFAIRLRRGREVVQELLGDQATAVVGSDRYVAYGHLPLSRRQVCWAHLKRTFETFVERGGEATVVGHQLLGETRKLFDWWRRVRDGTLARASFQVYVSGLRSRVRLRLWYGAQFADAETAATCRELLKVERALWTFARKNGVEPTNNAAEQALRHGVLWRHVCFGTHSAEGSRFAERMLTVRATLRQQGRGVLDYLTQACHAALLHRPAPSLLPEPP